MIPLIFILPRMVDSLHPGNGGNPAFSNYDLDSRMRLVFYPAVLGWILMGFWLSALLRRIMLLEHNKNEELNYIN
jgi:heme exporter protein C